MVNKFIHPHHPPTPTHTTTTGFAPGTVPGDAIVVRKSGGPLTKKRVHNMGVVVDRAMDFFGDGPELHQMMREDADGSIEIWTEIVRGCRWCCCCGAGSIVGLC